MHHRQLLSLLCVILLVPVGGYTAVIDESVRAQIDFFHYGGSEGPEADSLKRLIAGPRWWELRDSIKFEVNLIDHGGSEQPTRLSAEFQSASNAFDILRFEGLIRFYSNREHLADFAVEWAGRATADRVMSHSWDCDIILPVEFDFEFIPTLAIQHTTNRYRERLVMAPKTYAGYVVLRDGSIPPIPLKATSSVRQLWEEQRDAEIAAREAAERAEAERIALARVQQQVTLEPTTVMGPLKSSTREARAYESKWRDHARYLERELLLAKTTRARVTFQHPLRRTDRREFDFHTQSQAAERVYMAAIADCITESMEAERIDKESRLTIRRLRDQLQRIRSEPDEVSVSSSETNFDSEADETGKVTNRMRTETLSSTWHNNKGDRILDVLRSIRAENTVRAKYGLPRI